MRIFLALVLFVALATLLWNAAAAPPDWASSKNAVTIYDPDPNHIWNQLHAVFFVRDDLPGTERMPDVLDPPLWYHTPYLLTRPSHNRALRVLDQFLQTHAENLIHDPVRRAILQRDLWAVFDWAVERQPDRQGEPAYEKEKNELQTRLAEILRRLALSPEQIASLPDNYAEAVASGEFARDYDPAHRQRAFLPPDLFDPRGPWVKLEDPGNPDPIAFQHFSDRSARSSFLTFLRLPGGRKATFDYLQALWDFPERWVTLPSGMGPNFPEAKRRDLPQFPAGTEVALVRQMTLFDNQGKLINSPITESLQIRVYREIGPSDRAAAGSDEFIARSGQDFYDVRLSRPQLFAGKAGGLRSARPGEKDFSKFGASGPDVGKPNQYARLDQYAPILETCVMCHQQPGIYSLNSRDKLLKPHALQHDRPSDSYGPHWWQEARTLAWKQNHGDWGALTGYWKASASRP